MITRPLDLASKLRREPRSFDGLFFINGGLIVLFFLLFGARFVLAPGLDIDYQLPEIAGANAGARATTHYVTVVNAGQIFAGDGLRELEELDQWFREQARTVQPATLQIQASGDVEMSVITAIASAARRAGFVGIQIAATEPGTARKGAGW